MLELSQLQIDLFKSLAGIVLTVGLFTTIAFSIKLIVDRIPVKFIERIL